jgi:hypothetical protein
MTVDNAWVPLLLAARAGLGGEEKKSRLGVQVDYNVVHI